MDERTCPGCHGPMPVGCRERNPRRWCRQQCKWLWIRENDPERWAQILRQRAASEARRKAALRPDCKNCGAKVSTVKADYCSKRECRLIANAERERARYAANKDHLQQRVYAARAARTPEQIEADKVTARLWRERQGYSESKRAGDARRRALKRGAAVEKFTNGEIFDRDGWRCGICGKRINRRLAYPHPQSVSLDHVIPLSLGGEHSRANVRAAHLTCNVQRGAARAGADQLALI